QVERALEHVRKAEALAQAAEELCSSRLGPQSRARGGGPRSEGEADPHPGHEVAPVIEVEVGDRDRVDVRPLGVFAESTEHARSAIEQNAAPVCLEHVARMC